ncbi:MAG: tRNA 2-thiouridine(34) synthase MnmA [Patescibacteria group bacterium]
MIHSQKERKKAPKALIALSGGVDSSVAALLLQNEGYEITGVFIKISGPDFLPCTSEDDRLSALRVAAKLKIPFETIDLTNKYEKEVQKYIIREYREGRTPNPDTLCNRVIKFGPLFEYADQNGFEYVATGHYARTEEKDAEVFLSIAKDAEKDQSYFLWQVEKEKIHRILFPIGNLSKPEVRKIAEKFGLHTASKRESQGLCFLGKVDLKEFLEKFIPLEIGKVLDTKGKEIGEHKGVSFYTLGERHGFTVFEKENDSLPFYVVSKNKKDNTLTVSTTTTQVNFLQREIFLSEVNNFRDIEKGEIFLFLPRYRGKKVFGKVASFDSEKHTARIELEGSILAASGQSLVAYDGEKVVFGGIIEEKME